MLTSTGLVQFSHQHKLKTITAFQSLPLFVLPVPHKVIPSEALLTDWLSFRRVFLIKWHLSVYQRLYWCVFELFYHIIVLHTFSTDQTLISFQSVFQSQFLLSSFIFQYFSAKQMNRHWVKALNCLHLCLWWKRTFLTFIYLSWLKLKFGFFFLSDSLLLMCLLIQISRPWVQMVCPTSGVEVNHLSPAENVRKNAAVPAVNTHYRVFCTEQSLMSHLHAVHVNASTDPVLLTNQTQLWDAVQQPVIKLQRETEVTYHSF